MNDEIWLTRELAAKAFKKWNEEYLADPTGWGETGVLSDDGERCADYFLRLVEGEWMKMNDDG